jgi:hypothetical protein
MGRILRKPEAIAMSVIVTVKIPGDTDMFTRSLKDRADEFRQVGERGRKAGAIHHQFGVGDGFVLVVDEWESAEAFQQFFGDPQMNEFIASIGGGTSTAPDITVGEAIDSPDKF